MNESGRRAGLRFTKSPIVTIIVIMKCCEILIGVSFAEFEAALERLSVNLPPLTEEQRQRIKNKMEAIATANPASIAAGVALGIQPPPDWPKGKGGKRC